MSRTTRLVFAASMAAQFVVSSSLPAAAEFDSFARACRSTVAKSGGKLAKTMLKALGSCHATRNGDQTLVDTDCNFVDSGDLALKVPVAEAKFVQRVTLRCAALGPADTLYHACPSPCDADVPDIATYNDVAECLVCLTRARVETFVQTAYTEPQAPLENPEASCHRALTSSSSRFFNAILKDVAKCQARAENKGAMTTQECTETNYATIVSEAYNRAFAAIEDGNCASLSLPAAVLDACGNAGSSADLASCVLGAADSFGKDLVSEMLGLPTTTTTTTTTTSTTTTTTTLPVGDPLCPNNAQMVLYSRNTNTACATNAECDAPRTCDTALGTCTSSTAVDDGWTGFGHDADTNDGVHTRNHLYCPGPAGPTCGECTVVGLDAAPGDCRCANDSRVICDDPFSPASNDCPVAPACDSGPAVGSSCNDDADCSPGGCSRRCSNDVSVSCGSHAECPGGFCRSLSDKRCSDGASCETTGECTGTCGNATTAACDCYLGAPTPINSGETPLCVVHRLAENLSGTVDVDLGSSAIASQLSSTVHLGISRRNPCPTCGGTCSNNPAQFCDRDLDCSGGTCNLDPTPGDGLRGGVCSDFVGADSGQPCDVTATNANFPAYPIAEGPGGGGYSLDCMPDNNVSGQGLTVNLSQTTGVPQLDANVSCGGPNAALDCPCLMCSAEPTVSCNTDGDCSSQQGSCSLSTASRCDNNSDCLGVDAGPCLAGIQRCNLARSLSCATDADCSSVNVGACEASTCSVTGSAGMGESPLPNACDDLLCSDAGGGEGECSDGPDDRFCDGVVKANATGIVACATNNDCLPVSAGVDAGNCTIVERRKCFLDPIVATGSADPAFPVTAASFCIPPTSSSGLNSLLGLPGPGRAVRQSSLTTYCASNPLVPYTPGVGGCP